MILIIDFYSFTQGCGVGATVFGRVYSLLYAASNPKKLITCAELHRQPFANYRAKWNSRNTKNRRPSLILCHFWVDWMVPPNNRGPSPPRFVCHHGTLLALRVPLSSYTFIYPPHPLPLCKLSHLTTTTLYSSVPVALHNDGVAKITPS